jgi:hypothetical protein
VARTVTSPEGRTWIVRRRWVPWRLRFGRPWKPPRDSWRIVDFLDIGEFFPFIGWVFALLLLALLVFLFLPIAVFLIELLIFLALAGLAAVGRVLFRRPWIIEAESEGQIDRWRVAGWGASGRAINEVAEALQAGQRTVIPSDAQPMTD